MNDIYGRSKRVLLTDILNVENSLNRNWKFKFFNIEKQILVIIVKVFWSNKILFVYQYISNWNVNLKNIISISTFWIVIYKNWFFYIIFIKKLQLNIEYWEKRIKGVIKLFNILKKNLKRVNFINIIIIYNFKKDIYRI